MARPFVVLALALAGALAAAPAIPAHAAIAAQPPAGDPPRPRRPLADGARRQPQGSQPGQPRRPLADRPMRRLGPDGPGAPGIGGRGDAASMLLARTGELRLSDQQVTRLAAIARRAGDRRRALRTRVDSLRAAAPVENAPADRTALRTEIERVREQSRTDLRDALAVLTPDQHAQAWEAMMTRSAMGARAGVRRRMDRDDGPRGERAPRPMPVRPRREER